MNQSKGCISVLRHYLRWSWNKTRLWLWSKSHYKCFEAFDGLIRRKNFTNWSVKKLQTVCSIALTVPYESGISIPIRNCVPQYVISDRLKFLFSVLCSLFFLLCGIPYKSMFITSLFVFFPQYQLQLESYKVTRPVNLIAAWKWP